jgi:hypothetical protein
LRTKEGHLLTFSSVWSLLEQPLLQTPLGNICLFGINCRSLPANRAWRLGKRGNNCRQIEKSAVWSYISCKLHDKCVILGATGGAKTPLNKNDSKELIDDCTFLAN